MIDFEKVKVGDQLRIVGAGAPGFAKLGDIVTVTRAAELRVDVIREDGREAYFALTCGAARLEPVDSAEGAREQGDPAPSAAPAEADQAVSAP